ncbi:pilus assembly protein FimV [Nitrosomonas sp. Nm51]|uniref:FimV/HubP family polar landmark protein n=1 Tax=Nitrosomonas sp. Nm51 TaxID=133720 RepID=UPI0008B69670|nr:FimV/HubP family polar landmark protein [Nitrosomonas sp. Nm51]SEQ77074.1 pilus assembly protein FimV [Nitrosomonas sp. Nm51]
MYTSFFRACLLLIGFVFSLTAHAAGLGKLTINSSLGQPLNAEIDLVTVSEDEVSSLNAEIASREAFVQAGIRYEPFFSTFKISIESRVNGEPYVKIISPQSVNEPFLNMLVELSWASGRLLREYTVLLDPADVTPSEPVAPVVPMFQERTETVVEAETAPVDQAAAQTTPLAAADEPVTQMRQPVPTSPRPGTYGPILEGDTLSSIARQFKPESVNLNQMLVAIFRANRDAFIADNMNLLRTGVVLNIPDLQRVTEINEKEANAEVRVQVSDWHKYRQSLTLSAGQPQDMDALSQTAAGEITTAVDNAAASRSESPVEVLRLSSGEKLPDSQDGFSDLSAQERIRMMEEDAIARNLALKEANERVAMLEKNIENLQKLLSLQNSELAQAQINAETQAQPSQTETEALEIIPEKSVASPDDEFGVLSENESTFELDVASEDDSFSLPAKDATVQDGAETEALATLSPATQVELAANSVLAPESEEASWFDRVTGNMMYIGAVSALLLLTLLAFILRRRRQAAAAEAEAEESRYEELSSALRDKTAAAVAAAHVVDQKTDGQNDFEQTNQFFSQEESQEKDDSAAFDLSTDENESPEIPKNKLYDADQPIELDFSKENEEADAGIESSIDESDAALGMNAFDESISEAKSLDDTLQENTDQILDFNAETEAMVAMDQEASVENSEIDEAHIMDFTAETSRSTEDAKSDYELKIDFDDELNSEINDAMQMDLADDKLTMESTESESKSDIENALDFSVDSSTIDLSDESNLLNESAHGVTTPESEDNTSDAPGLDFTSEPELPEIVSEGNETLSSDSDKLISEVDFSDIDLNVENTSGSVENKADEEIETVESASDEPEARSEQWHEIETKIDLAKAYLEMEDMEGAREMLEEVVQEGDENQQKTARELLEKL